MNLMSAATAPPRHAFKTSELVGNLMHKLSPELINSINSLGVEQRYSTLENYPEFLSAKPKIAPSATTELGVAATRRCIETWGGDASRIGLLVAATNTPDQMLPCLCSQVLENET